MRKSRFKEEQIIGILKESEAGVATPELSQARDRVADALPVEGEVRRDGSERGEAVAALEEENRQLKHAVAELLLDKRALQAVVTKKW